MSSGGLYTVRESPPECGNVQKGEEGKSKDGIRDHSPTIKRSRGGGQREFMPRYGSRRKYGVTILGEQ